MSDRWLEGRPYYKENQKSTLFIQGLRTEVVTCTEVIEPFLVVVILSCMVPISVASVGWYPTAEGILPSKADT